MKIPESRALLLLWTIEIIICFAAQLQHVSTDNIPRLSGILLDATSHAQLLRAPNKNREAEFQNLQRRGGGGSASPSVALGSFQLETKVFKSFSTIVPGKLAALYITDFLDIVALRIETGFWGLEPPAKHRIIRMWDFELSFYSLNTAVPWDFIQAYVIEMADEIARGFVGTFDEYMTGVINGVATAVTVKLKMMTKDPPLVVR